MAWAYRAETPYLDPVKGLQRVGFCQAWGAGSGGQEWLCEEPATRMEAVLAIKEGGGRESSGGHVVISLWLFPSHKSVNSSPRRMKRWSSPLGP